MYKSLLFVLFAHMFVSNASAVVINEIRSDQPGADVDEYVEISGTPNTDLTGLTHLIIGDGAGDSGTIESVVSLDANSINPDGLFTIARNASILGGTITPDLVTSNLTLENSDNVTHLLVSDFTGSRGDDIDTNDDGILDTQPWSSIVDSIAMIETDPSVEGEQVYSSNQVGPINNFVPAHVFRCGNTFQIGTFDVNDANASDTPTALNDCTGSGGGGPTVVTVATIPEIQSSADSSPFAGQLVETTGIVTADFTGDDQLRGFYFQDVIGDGDLSSSDGLFVFYPNGAVDVAVGDVITVTAEVTEFFDFTELTNVSELVVNSANNPLPTPATITLPESVDGELERYEGMLVEVAVEMTVSQNFFISRFGQMTLSSPDDEGNAGRLFQPTNRYPANSPEAIALADENARRVLVLDDGQDISGFGDNPDPVPYLGRNPVNVIRAGDTVTNLIGVLDYGRINANSTPARDYRLHPTQTPVFAATNPRENAPAEVGGRVTVASFNVLNYFTTIDNGGSNCGPLDNLGCRGADSATELQRQQDKLVQTLVGLNADIVGLIEVENNGFGANSAIQTLVDALNLEVGTPEYSVVPVQEGPTPGLGGDAITVGFIYKPGVVDLIGDVATLSTGAFSDAITDGGFSRQPVAASFEDKRTKERFTAVINHFKSKRPPSTVQNNGNDDQGDGQGSWNLRRVEAANDLANWLATHPTNINDDDILILGDLNAYAQEDPLLALFDKGYVDAVKRFNGDNSYSFIFDGQSGSLDHALVSNSLLGSVSGVVHWHTNADEPAVIDYNTDFNPSGYYEVSPYRASDHDTILIGLDFTSQEACYVIPIRRNNRVVTFCL